MPKQPLVILFLLLILLGISFFLWQKTDPGIAEQVHIGGSFSLTNTKEETVSDADFEGKIRVMYFGFANCPSICPYDMEALTLALRLLDPEERAQLAPVFVTIDPERDDAAALRSFLGQFHKDIIGLTGSREQIDIAKKAFRVFAQKEDEDGDLEDGLYNMNHTAFFYILDREGNFLRHVDHAPDPAQFAEILRHLISTR